MKRILLVGILAVAVLFAATFALLPSNPPPMVTITSKDVGGPVNIWRDYADRSKGIAGTVQDGERVQLLERSDAAARIRTSSGVDGWLNIAFIRSS